MNTKLFIILSFIVIFSGRIIAQSDYVQKDTSYITSPNNIALKTFYVNVEDAEGACSNEGKQLRIRGLKDKGYTEFTIPNAETVTFVVKGKSSSEDRIVNIFRDGELIESITNLDADHCAIFSETISRNAPVTYKISGGDDSSTKPVVLKSIVVEKYVGISSGIKRLESNNLKIYPNPVQSTLNITIPVDTKAISAKIYNAAGQLVLSSFINKESFVSFQVDSFPKGFYYIVVLTEQGQISSKFIKQ